MPLMIYSSLSRKKEPFEPIDAERKRVTIYNCGPTVYDHFHIGNARNFVLMDIIRRYLARTYEVKFVQNLTDIDDKIINRAQKEGVSFEEIRDKYTKAYFEDAAKLGIRPADVHPRATEYIPQMIELMKKLEAKGMAYPAGGSLYFRVRKFPEYGKLSCRSVDDMLEGARVEISEEKEDPLDFVLWKAAKPGEPKWPSPWGEGRPGWHLECSTMSMAILGQTIDIHGGGIDLMFPHHENEIAQSESATGKPFVRYWLHNGFLNIDHQKMAKSLGNFLKIDQVLANYLVPSIRLFLMSAHYRSPLDYSSSALDESTSAVRRINEGLETGEKILKLGGHALPNKKIDRNAIHASAKAYLDQFEAAMDDDFNTPRAVAVLQNIVTAIHEERKKTSVDHNLLAALVGIGNYLRDFFGLDPQAAQPASAEAVSTFRAILENVHKAAVDQGLQNLPASPADVTKSQIIEQLIEYRMLARKQKAYTLADTIRKSLAGAGIALEDHAQGTIWKEMNS